MMLPNLRTRAYKSTQKSSTATMLPNLRTRASKSTQKSRAATMLQNLRTRASRSTQKSRAATMPRNLRTRASKSTQNLPDDPLRVKLADNDALRTPGHIGETTIAGDIGLSGGATPNTAKLTAIHAAMGSGPTGNNDGAATNHFGATAQAGSHDEAVGMGVVGENAERAEKAEAISRRPSPFQNPYAS